MILLNKFKEGQGEEGIVQKGFNFISYKYIRQRSVFFLSPVSHLTKDFSVLLSSETINKPCTGLQTFLYIISAPFRRTSFLVSSKFQCLDLFLLCFLLNVECFSHPPLQVCFIKTRIKRNRHVVLF